MLSPELGVGHEATRIRHAPGRCSGDVAAIREGAAAGDAGYRVPPRRVARVLRTYGGGVPPRPERNRL